MATQIIDKGVSLEIITDGVPKFVIKANIKTVEVLIGSIIKIDIGKGSLYNIYVDQVLVTEPVSTDPNDLRDKIVAMLQSAPGNAAGATAENQLLQTTELQGIKTSLSSLTEKVNDVNDKVFFEPKLIDETRGNTIYKGYALPGTPINSPTFAIQRVTNNNGNLSYHWAGGNRNFDKLWDARTNLQYS